MSKYNPLEVVPELRTKLKTKARIYKNLLAFLESAPMSTLLGTPEDLQSVLTTAQEERVTEAIGAVRAEVTRMANRGSKKESSTPVQE